jgi:hypothetical protein
MSGCSTWSFPFKFCHQYLFLVLPMHFHLYTPSITPPYFNPLIIFCVEYKLWHSLCNFF